MTPSRLTKVAAMILRMCSSPLLFLRRHSGFNVTTNERGASRHAPSNFSGFRARDAARREPDLLEDGGCRAVRSLVRRQPDRAGARGALAVRYFRARLDSGGADARDEPGAHEGPAREAVSQVGYEDRE